MAGETVITLIGNLTGDPELRSTGSGADVVNFTVASTPRTFDRQANEWKDGETLFMRCTAWRDMALNIERSLSRGNRVVVTGRLQSRTFDTKEGDKRTVIEMQVDEIGPSLAYAEAKITRNDRKGGGDSGGRSSSREERPSRDREERSSRRRDEDDDRGGRDRDRGERAPRERAPRERSSRPVEDSGDDLDY